MNNLLPRDVVETKLNAALDQLALNDSYLIAAGLNERTVTHKLAEHLQEQFPDWDVDCEYNRDGLDTKTLFIPSFDENLEDSPVYPDVIVHERGDWRHFDRRPHLLVIEARKAGWGPGKIARDQTKVTAYLSQLRYRFGALIEYSFENGAPRFAIDFREGPEGGSAKSHNRRPSA